MRQKKIALNAALKTADTKAVCAVLEELVRRAPNVSKLAHEASIDRSILYRTFRGKKGPRLLVVLHQSAEVLTLGGIPKSEGR